MAVQDELTVRPLGLGLGAEIVGVDLAGSITPSDVVRLKRALAEHHLLCFRGAPRSDAELVRCAEVFGTPFDGLVPPGHVDNRDEDGTIRGLAELDWHADHTRYAGQLPKEGFLECVMAPRQGGRTSFVSTYEVFEAFPSSLQQHMRELFVLFDRHPYAARQDRQGEPPTEPPVAGYRSLSHVEDRVDATVHPLVISHPDSGREALFITPVNAMRILGVSQSESDELMALIFSRVLAEAPSYTHTWSVGDLLVWDQLGTWHRRETFASTDPRHLRNFRTVIKAPVHPAP